MPVYENSRYVSATQITEVTVDELTGEHLDPLTWLLDDRRQFNPDDYRNNIVVTPEKGETPDMLANRMFQDATLWWVVAEFNDSVGFDPFRTFDGVEQVILPSPETLFTEILNADPEEF